MVFFFLQFIYLKENFTRAKGKRSKLKNQNERLHSCLINVSLSTDEGVAYLFIILVQICWNICTRHARITERSHQGMCLPAHILAATLPLSFERSNVWFVNCPKEINYAVENDLITIDNFFLSKTQKKRNVTSWNQNCVIST